MIVITVARKPLSEPNVAANVLKHSCGAVNVDACRIRVTDGTVLGRNNKPGPNGWKNSSGGPSAAMSNPAAAAGRWPANLILQHLEGCTNGCVPGCPVADLDAQSGDSKSPQTYVRGADGFNATVYGQAMGEPAGKVSLNYGDGGGASRYFKQVGGKR